MIVLFFFCLVVFQLQQLCSIPAPRSCGPVGLARGDLRREVGSHSAGMSRTGDFTFETRRAGKYGELHDNLRSESEAF